MHGGGCIMLWVCLSSARTREFFRIKRNRIELSTWKILEENLVQSAFQQTLGDKFTFQKDNNLKYKTKYTLELLTKITLNVPEWPSYSFDLNRLENLWQDLIKNQLDRA
uniref:Transposable element Tc1 transposase n=1 Tax=Oncorhynchus tshawytscha TaxID=74940 RepID=A0AAZ3S6B0_ONCTS